MQEKDLSSLTHSEKIEIILLQAEQINLLKESLERLKVKIKMLEEKKHKNSRNSSKPPSSDHKKTQSLRKKSNKNPGGQPGHKGYCLKLKKHPDEIQFKAISHCVECGYELNKRADLIDIRQVFEVPQPKIWIIEHQSEIKECRKCECINKAGFPKGVTQKTQYGPRAKGLMVYLSQYQFLPYQRIRLLFKDLYNQVVSAGTVLNAVNESANSIITIDNKLKELLSQGNLLNADETGMNIAGDKYWLHIASNAHFTHYALHKRRGCLAMDDIGILAQYQGTLVHDHWSSYFKYPDAKHGLCNAHHLRELKFLYEVQGFNWANRMSDLLMKIHDKKEIAKSKGLAGFSKYAINSFIKSYQDILVQGKRAQAAKGTKDAGNLLKRLSLRQAETLLFMHDFTVPFSNNQAEQDARMMKVQQKITGGFRTFMSAKNFCLNRSIISTAIKNNKNILKIFQWVFQNKLTLNRLIPAEGYS
ncbi:MAG: Transposase [Francisellaceae bacterium]|nr:Transposase [Francisellaceae bacterium]